MPAQLTSKPTVHDQFRRDVLDGLRAEQKHLPSKYFYDRQGSVLFDRICELPEYYPTRAELAIMRQHADEMAECIGSQAMIIELGSGSSIKIGLLLRRLPRPTCYVPIDISGEHLQEAADRIARKFTDVEVCPLHADFSDGITLPQVATDVERRVAYFPGSTIGNFRPAAAHDLLTRIAEMVGPGGGLLIGFDLVKRRDILERAYDDAQQVTAAFNKNLLRRINRELDGDFRLAEFSHRAIYNATHDRIEMHLVSDSNQTVSIGDEQVGFSTGESICTELSHKYRIESFNQTAAQAGFSVGNVWTDSDNYFAVAYYSVEE